MLYVDKKWVNVIGQRIDMFKWQTEDVARGRCPICGDSKKSKSKTRLYFYPVDGKYFIRCHNCGASKSIGNFIKDQFPEVYSDYTMERFTEKSSSVGGMQTFTEPQPKVKEKPKPVVKNNRLTPLSDLNPDHPAMLYVKERNIPDDAICHIYFTKNFAYWVELVYPQKYQKLPTDSRIVFPIYDKTGEHLIGAQGRCLGSSNSIRYITLKFDTDESKLYGRERLNTSHPILVTEGPIDSLFLPNCLALCGGDVSYDLKEFDSKNVTVVLDNEPRSKETIARYEKVIDSGFNIVIWSGIPSNLKDVNDMILAGYSRDDIVSIIKNNSYSGMKAKLKLSTWKKV